MNIAGCHGCFQHKTVLVAGGMRLIGELTLVLSTLYNKPQSGCNAFVTVRKPAYFFLR